jgi:ATP-dependent DNA helicase RecQ
VYQICARGWPYGKSMVADVLKGADNEKVRKAGLGRLKTFGLLSGLPRRRIADVIDRMERDELLAVSGDRYPVVTLGEKSGMCQEDDFRYVIRTPKREEPSGEADRTDESQGRRRGAGKAGGGEAYLRDAAPFDEDLFETLRALRRRLADESGVPAFVVFSDAALRDMCRVIPNNEESFLSVSGVGKVKLEQYGDIFINAIREWTESNTGEAG